MASASNILGAATKFHHRYGLGDEVAGACTKNGHTKHRIGLGIGVNFDKSVGVAGGLSAAIGHEVKLAFAVIDASFFELGFALTDHG